MSTFVPLILCTCGKDDGRVVSDGFLGCTELGCGFVLLCQGEADGEINGGTLGSCKVGFGIIDGCTLGGRVVDAGNMRWSLFLARLAARSEMFGKEVLVSCRFLNIGSGTRHLVDVGGFSSLCTTLGSMLPVPTVLFLLTLCENRLASCVRVSVVDCSTGSRSGAFAVDFRALWRSYAAESMRDSREAVGIFTLWGYHFTVSQMRLELVDGIQMRWHR